MDWNATDLHEPPDDERVLVASKAHGQKWTYIVARWNKHKQLWINFTTSYNRDTFQYWATIEPPEM